MRSSDLGDAPELYATLHVKGAKMSVTALCRSASGVGLSLAVSGSLLPISAYAVSANSVPPGPASPAMPNSEGEAKVADAVSLEPLAVVEVLPSPRRARWFGRLSAGFAYRWAFRESLLGGAFEGELGAQDNRFAGGVRLRVEAGRMQAGLLYQVVTLGPSFWLPSIAERLRFGMGLEAGAVMVDRRTVPGSAMWTVAWGGRIDAAVDLVRVGTSGGLFFSTGVAAQVLTAAPFPVTVVAGAALGYRP